MTNTGHSDETAEPTHPGWQAVAKLANVSNPLFDKLLVLLGYEFSSNTYVITGDSLAIVDPGNDYTGFVDLWSLGFKPADVRKVAVSHGHRDHVMGAFELVRAYPSVLEKGGFELIVHEAGPREIKEAMRQLGCRVTEVRGGETIELGGFELEVIHTPGHTIDGICLNHAATKTAFTGDTVLPHAMAGPDQAAGGQLESYLHAMRMLLAKDIENILPGHGLPVAGAGRQVIEQTYESLMLKIIGAEEKIQWMAGATALAERGLLAESIFCADKEIARDPYNASALQLKVACLNDLGQFQEALRVLDQLAGLSQHEPGNAFALVGRGYALMGLARYDESLQAFDNALALTPGSRDALIYKGMVLYLAGRPEEAMEIEEFRTEFLERFKDELARKNAHA